MVCSNEHAGSTDVICTADSGVATAGSDGRTTYAGVAMGSGGVARAELGVTTTEDGVLTVSGGVVESGEDISGVQRIEGGV